MHLYQSIEREICTIFLGKCKNIYDDDEKNNLWVFPKTRIIFNNPKKNKINIKKIFFVQPKNTSTNVIRSFICNLYSRNVFTHTSPQVPTVGENLKNTSM